MAADTTKSIQHILERQYISLNADASDPASTFNDITVEDDATVGGDLAVTGNVTLTGSLIDATATEGATIKNIIDSGTIAVTVPSITDPDIAKVDVDVSALTFAVAVGDAVIARPTEALPTNCRFQSAIVTATDTIQVTFGSEGGNVTGAAKNFKFLIFDLT